MSIYIGNQTAFFTAVPEEPFVYGVKNGFTAFEWFNDKKYYDDGGKSGWGYDDVSDKRAGELKEIAQKCNIRFSVHASCVATPFSAEGMDELVAAFSMAEKIGAALVNIHLITTEGIGNFVRAIKPVVSIAAEKNIALAIENTPLHSPDDFNVLFSELQEQNVLSQANIGMCLDIGHANCCAATRNDYIAFIDRLNSDVKIIHGHVHENWGDSDSHLALFTGASKNNDRGVKIFIQKLKERNYSGSLIMEQWPQEHETLNNAFSRLVYIIGEQAVVRKSTPDDILELLVNDEVKVDAEDSITKEEVTLADTTVVKRDTASVSCYYKRVRVERDTEDWVVDEIISFSHSKKSWRRRLDGVKDLFFDGRSMSKGDLAAISVYLRFLSTAEITCEEDGGHYRPCHHARAAEEIEEAVEKLKSPENSWIIRKIYPYLPSHAEEFTRHEPLTRIRDIAHRNDIPKDMKLDIKHNLQNKLHRSAGPEDLITAKRILDTINSNVGGYSHDFVEQYNIFYQELLEFFNAAGLEKRLEKIIHDVPKLAGEISSFLHIKGSGDALSRADAALQLRGAMGSYLEVENSLVELHIADSELEDFSFAAISEAFNSVCGGKLTHEFFRLLGITLKHIGLNMYLNEEVNALIHEFSVWKENFQSNPDREVKLRIWASMQRGLRLCAGFADLVTRLFAASVIEFGKAFKIPPHAVDVYCEGDIRANIIFQLSKILGKLSSILLPELGFPPWSVINGGKAAGEVVQSDNIREFEEKTGNYIVLLNKAEGDEEIPAAVRAILLAHPLGHLSHLGVRARSGNIPFAAAEEIGVFNSFTEYAGSVIAFEFTEDGVEEISDADSKSIESSQQLVVDIPNVKLSNEVTVIHAQDITADSCGGKASASAEMYNKLADFESFSAPKVMAIPYGVMELCLREQQELLREYNSKVDSLESIADAEVDNKLAEIRDVIGKIVIPSGIIESITDNFGSECRMAVRSSSSGEDLKGFAGAGLYESIIGVRAEDLASAIKEVWASLWTSRATLSRKKYRIPHSAVYMGVLLQEVIPAEFSFVLHTANPVTGAKDEIGLELAVGFGETLASGNQSGSPCRIKKNIVEKKLIIEKCADISRKLVLKTEESGLVYETIDYADFPLFLGGNLISIAEDLSCIGKELEYYFGVAQDIEGAYSNGKYYIVQSRAQAGLEG